MRNRTIAIAIVVIVVLAIVLLVACWWLAGFVMTGKRQTLDEAFAWQSEHYDTSFYEGLAKTDYVAQGADGYELHVEELANPSPTSRYVIISHGYTDNRMGALKYVPMYLALGYNCVIYDLRGHGLNEPTCTTYGLLEGEDLALLVESLRERHPELTQLGLHGESLGAASTLSSLRFQPRVDFVVSDCAFADIVSVLREGYRNAHVPVFLVDLADFGARIRYHCSLKDMRPIDALEGNQIPILFVHGSNDTLIAPKNSGDLAKTSAGSSALCIVDGAGHAESILTDPEGYQTAVEGFLQDLS